MVREQENLLRQIQSKYKISDEVARAFEENPRHLFIKRHYLIDEMYADYPLEIYSDGEFISTISQPSFVLLMIDLLDLKPGHRVIELGAGSGWNAALMGSIVGDTGRVISIEIIPYLAQETRENLKSLGIKNVEVVYGDGALGFDAEAPYDRGVFTAGATDLPRAFHEQIKIGGKLLFVLKTPEVDLLLILEKHLDYFQEIKRIRCSFVPMKGMKKAEYRMELSYLSESHNPVKIYLNDKSEGPDSVFSTT